jgi:hypothetical protein
VDSDCQVCNDDGDDNDGEDKHCFEAFCNNEADDAIA